MKNLLLIVILAAIGGWYYYDKFEKPKRAADSPVVEEQADPRMAELSKRAEELYPTRVEERSLWLSRQYAALSAIDKKSQSLSADVYGAILESAKEKYGLDYEKQLEFVSRQRLAAIDVYNMIKASDFPKDDLDTFERHAKLEFGNDYVMRRNAYARILDAYGSIKGKSAMLPPQDYKKLLEKVMPALMKNPDEALRVFDAQSLARHNFLTKKFPESYGDLRKNIEAEYPDDYVAQLEALNVRLDAAGRRGVAACWGTAGRNIVTPLSKEYFSKYIYAYEEDSKIFVSFFLEIKGRKALVFSAGALDSFPKICSLDLGGGQKLESDKIYASETSMFALVIPENSENFSTVPAMAEEEIAAKSEMNVEIIGYDLSGSQLALQAKLKNGDTIEAGTATESALNRKMRAGAIIVDSESKKAVGLLEEVPGEGASYYASFENPSVENIVNLNERVSRWNGLAAVMPLVKKAIEKPGKRVFRVVKFSELQNVKRYVPSDYAVQHGNVERLCRSNFSALTFMVVGRYSEDNETEIVRTVARKYAPIFIKGSRVNVSILYSNFSNYAREIRSQLAQNVKFARGDFYSRYYYAFKSAAKAQGELFARLDGVISRSLSSPDKSQILHADLAREINGSTYVPPGRNFTRAGFSSGGGGGSVLRMSN